MKRFTLSHASAIKTLATTLILSLVTGVAHAATIALTGGTIDVESSWVGTPDQGYSNVSNSDSVTHGPTFLEVAYSSLPLSIAANQISDTNQGGNAIGSTMNMNWGGTVEGPRDFTFAASVDETFHLSTPALWSVYRNIDPVTPFSYFNLERANGSMTPIDLLTVSAGALLPGNYRLRGEAAGAWSYSGLSFFHGNFIELTFTGIPVPEPASWLLLTPAAVGWIGLRRRRRRDS